MAIYNDEKDGVDVFLRGEPPPPEVAQAPPPKSGGGSAFSLLGVLLMMAILVVATATAWYWYKPELQLAAPNEDSLPFRTTADYLATYDEIVELVGPGASVADAGDTVVDWSLDGTGTAVIHVDVAGPEGKTEAWAEWTRRRESWTIDKASYLSPAGERSRIPLGDGVFLTGRDLVTWRRADPGTPLGQGQRELIQGRELQAIKLFNDSLAASPEDKDALLWRGKAYEQLGNLQRAQADYQLILSFDPTNDAALSGLDGMRASPPPGEDPVAPPPRAEPRAPSPSPTALIPE